MQGKQKDGAIKSITFGNPISVTTTDGVKRTYEEYKAYTAEKEKERQDFIRKATTPTHAYTQDVQGNIWGIADYSALEEAKWWQKVAAFLSKKYKRKFLKLKPIPLDGSTEPSKLVSIEYIY